MTFFYSILVFLGYFSMLTSLAFLGADFPTSKAMATILAIAALGMGLASYAQRAIALRIMQRAPKRRSNQP